MMEEHIEGYVVDIACLRSWHHDELQQRARRHSTTCAEEHVESGYALVDGCAVPLDPAATPQVQRALREATREQGVRLHALRKRTDKGMRTHFIELALEREPVESSNIRAVGYQDRMLEVEFKSGVYQYLDVPREVYDGLLDAESRGRYFNDHIKNRFQSRKIA